LLLFSSLGGAFVIIVLGLSSFFIVRFYALPVVIGDHYADNIELNGVTYELCDKEYAFDKSLRMVGRSATDHSILTPEWALAVLFSSSYYFKESQNPDYIYYPGLMGWVVCKRK